MKQPIAPRRHFLSTALGAAAAVATGIRPTHAQATAWRLGHQSSLARARRELECGDQPMKVLVVSVAWSNTVGTPWTSADVQAMATKCREWYLTDSYGKLDLRFTIGPWIGVSSPDNVYTEPPTNDALLTARGFPPGNYDRQIYLTTRNEAAKFKGLCWGKGMWVNCMLSDYAPFAMIHEFGHSLGLAHPLKLAIGSQVGNVLSLPPLDVTTGGQVTQLYDGSTSMGYEATFANFSAYEKASLGWITPAVYSGGDQTYTLTPLSVAGGALYAVRIPMATFRASSKRVYWVEYRTDTVAANGIQIRVANDFGCLLPAHINSAFQVGDRVTDGTIVFDVAGPGVVRVRTADIAPPTTQPRPQAPPPAAGR